MIIILKQLSSESRYSDRRAALAESSERSTTTPQKEETNNRSHDRNFGTTKTTQARAKEDRKIKSRPTEGTRSSKLQNLEQETLADWQGISSRTNEIVSCERTLLAEVQNFNPNTHALLQSKSVWSKNKLDLPPNGPSCKTTSIFTTMPARNCNRIKHRSKLHIKTFVTEPQPVATKD